MPSDVLLMPAPPAIKALGGRSLTGGSKKQRDWAERIRLSIASMSRKPENFLILLETLLRPFMPNATATHSRNLRSKTAKNRNNRLVADGGSRFSVLLSAKETAALAAILARTGESKA
jgi:hypothetical protein